MTETKNIVIIDDHVMVRKGLCALINLLTSYKILFDADNGRDMIEKMKQHNLPDIVLLDINMPEMDGYDTAQWLKTHHPGVIVLALSIMDTETAIISMIRNGAKGYILKDSDPGELKEAFDAVLKIGYYYNDFITHKLVNSLTNLGNECRLAALSGITARELEFLRLSCSERTYQQIAKDMAITERTVDGYRDVLFKKFQVSSRVGMVIYALKNNLVQL